MIRDFNYKSTIDQFEKDFLTQLLSASRGNMSEAARMSGIYRANIYRMAKRLDINLTKGEYRHGH
jgi:transcriptional regulator of acetoin/glycerol metabolism